MSPADNQLTEAIDIDRADDGPCALVESVARIRRWAVTKALPLWEARAQRPDGSWVEHLDLNGQPDLTAERRWRVIARQAVAYAQATLAGWYDGRNSAIRSFDAYWSQGFIDNHIIHRMASDGTISDGRHDLYDHAFGYLACARLFQLTHARSYLDAADRIREYMDLYKQETGGWGEGTVKPYPRRQNPHMHWLEASLAMYEATGNRSDLEIADEVMALFNRYFLRTDVIGEFFTRDWSLDPETGTCVEPGHAAEWIWLLGQYDRATGSDHSAAQHALYARAFRHRLIRLYDEERADGDIIRETTRCWVQTEAIKAHLAMADRGVPGAIDMAAATIDALLETFLLSDGSWADQLNACGTPVAKTIPVSTFYHIIGMAVEAERVSDEPPSSRPEPQS